MKKIKVLTPIITITTLSTAVTAISGCSCNKTIDSVELSDSVKSKGVTIKTADIVEAKQSTIVLNLPAKTPLITSIKMTVGSSTLTISDVIIVNNKITIPASKMTGSKVVINTITLSVDVTQIDVTTLPTTVEYEEGDPLDLTDMVVKATLTDGTTKDVTSECTTSPAAGATLAKEDTKVTVTYKNKTTDFAITVSESTTIKPACLTIGEASTFTWTTQNTSTLEYSINDGEWTSATSGTKVDLPASSTIKLRGKLTSKKYSVGNTIKIEKATDNASVVLSGSIMSLLNNGEKVDELPDTWIFYNLFKGSTALKSIDENTSGKLLPAKQLKEYCYYGMFSGCTNLINAPSLPSTQLANSCYAAMFDDCANLKTAPKLDSKNLATFCYGSMFQGCTLLTVAPELSATTLAVSCYYGMFNGCTSLTKTPSLPAVALTDECYKEMFNGCTSLSEIQEIKCESLNMRSCWGMFYNCTSLKINNTGSTGTPFFTCPNDTTAYECVNEMFKNTQGGIVKPEAGKTYYYEK